MRNLDFVSRCWATIEFDRAAELMDRVLSTDMPQSGYPPCNVEKVGNDVCRISIAVAGFSPRNLSVEVRDGNLVVAAPKAEEKQAGIYLHRGIAISAFERRFALADHVRVAGVDHENRVLHINLIREIL